MIFYYTKDLMVILNEVKNLYDCIACDSVKWYNRHRDT